MRPQKILRTSVSSFDNQRRNSYFYTRYYISIYLPWMKSVLRLNKVPFALNFYIFEHTPILDQNCKFIEKPPSAKQNMRSGAYRKLLYLQFFSNLPALYLYQTLEKGFDLTSVKLSTYWSLKKIGTSHEPNFFL